MHSADEFIQFKFGQYTCSIYGDGKVICLIPESWRSFQRPYYSSEEDCKIFLEDGLKECVSGVSDGWHVQGFDEESWIEFVQQGKTVLSMKRVDAGTILVRLRRCLDSYVRLGIQYAMLIALHQKCIGLHGVTLLCRDEIVILSAPSGTGKTTLSRLLEKYCDALVINGDFALLSPTDKGVFFEPTPFCGTSRRSLNHRVRVNRVVFLGQSKSNQWCSMTGREAMSRFMSNAFIPAWDPVMRQAVMDNISRCILGLTVNEFTFAPVREAAEKFCDQL